MPSLFRTPEMGNYAEMDEMLSDGSPFARTYFKLEDSIAEYEISKVLLRNPHPNIVRFYDVTDKYFDTEVLYPLYPTDIRKGNIDKDEFIESMSEAKAHLQSLGIYYTAWEVSDTGMSEDYNICLSDFGLCGYGKYSAYGYRYRDAVSIGLRDPEEIDNHAFDVMVKEVLAL